MQILLGVGLIAPLRPLTSKEWEVLANQRLNAEHTSYAQRLWQAYVESI